MLWGIGGRLEGLPGILGLNLSGIGDDCWDSRDSGVESVGCRARLEGLPGAESVGYRGRLEGLQGFWG